MKLTKEEVLMIVECFPTLMQNLFGHYNTVPENGLNPTQEKILMLINHFKTPSMNTMARKMFLVKSAITSIIDSLIEKQYVDRYRDKADRRVVRVKLTEKGIQAVKKVDRHLAYYLNSQLANFSDSEITELMQAIHSIHKIALLIKERNNIQEDND